MRGGHGPGISGVSSPSEPSIVHDPHTAGGPRTGASGHAFQAEGEGTKVIRASWNDVRPSLRCCSPPLRSRLLALSE